MYQDTTSGTWNFCVRCGRAIFGSATWTDEGAICAVCANPDNILKRLAKIEELLEKMYEELMLIRMKKRW